MHKALEFIPLNGMVPLHFQWADDHVFDAILVEEFLGGLPISGLIIRMTQRILRNIKNTS